MNLHNPSAEIYVPDGSPAEAALARTTHMGVGAHQDDLEIMAYHGILECFCRTDQHFTGVTLTNGSGSPRDDLYANYTDEQMQQVRRVEQKKAALVGEYSAHVFLDYPSSAAKDGTDTGVIEDLKSLFRITRPRVIYTHNPADKHDTHVATALRVIRALCELPESLRPQKLYGCEVWRGLDWVNDEEKVVFNVEAHENLATALVSIFDSQVCGGKRYDLATMGRRRANATYLASHATDVSRSVIFAIDLTALIKDPRTDIKEYIGGFLDRFAKDVLERIARVS